MKELNKIFGWGKDRYDGEDGEEYLGRISTIRKLEEPKRVFMSNEEYYVMMAVLGLILGTVLVISFMVFNG